MSDRRGKADSVGLTSRKETSVAPPAYRAGPAQDPLQRAAVPPKARHLGAATKAAVPASPTLAALGAAEAPALPRKAPKKKKVKRNRTAAAANSPVTIPPSLSVRSGRC